MWAIGRASFYGRRPAQLHNRRLATASIGGSMLGNPSHIGRFSSSFIIKEHIVPCQHIRNYPRATSGNQEEELHMAIKQYTPYCNTNPLPGDVTIIGTHGNGFPKELYEPLWEDLLSSAKQAGVSIRNIWIADMAHQGMSGLLNQDKLGNDPSWFDHARDLNHMINHFRNEMIRPIVGVGHSVGGHSLIHLSLFHPRLLEALVLIEPGVFSKANYQGGYVPAFFSTRRRDTWPSQATAVESFQKKEFYRRWDTRVFERWIKYGLRHRHCYPPVVDSKSSENAVEELETDSVNATLQPTNSVVLNPELVTSDASPPDATVTLRNTSKEVTLTTTKHQEVFMYLRPTFDPNISSNIRPRQQRRRDSSRIPDYHPDSDFPKRTFYRPEPIITFGMLPSLSPPALFVFGDQSDFFTPESRRDIFRNTGTGIGGSGGAESGNVEEVTIPNASHLVPMEQAHKTSECIANWLAVRMQHWREKECLQSRVWEDVSEIEKRKISPEFAKALEDGFSKDDNRRT